MRPGLNARPFQGPVQFSGFIYILISVQSIIIGEHTHEENMEKTTQAVTRALDETVPLL